MSGGIGTLANHVTGYGDADSWGGPANGIDVLNHISSDAKHGRTANVASDTYMFMVIIGSLALLWFLGGVVFKNARL